MSAEQIFHPLIGAAGTAQAQARDYDGRWFVADDAGWVSPGDCPALRDIQTEIKLGYLVLRAPGMLRLDIPLDVIEDDDSVRFKVCVGASELDVVDEGELAAAWLSNVAGRSCALMKVHPEALPFAWATLMQVSG